MPLNDFLSPYGAVKHESGTAKTASVATLAALKALAATDPAHVHGNVVLVDAVRTPFGKAGANGIYAETRADDLVVAVFRELLRRNPSLPAERIDDVAVAATTAGAFAIASTEIVSVLNG